MDKRKTISWAITCCNELNELTELLNFLQTHIKLGDEIIVQYDSSSVTSEVLDYLKIMDKMHENHIIIGFPLNDDFATFKNNLKLYCNKEYIFQCDADEQPHEHMVEYLGDVLEKNPVDLVFIPRINIVDGLTEEYAIKYGWKISKLESQIGEKIIDTESEEYKFLKKLGYIITENPV